MYKLSIHKALISISCQLASACSGLQCNIFTAAVGQGTTDPIGSKAKPPGRRGLICEKLTALGHNLAAMQAIGTGSAAETRN